MCDAMHEVKISFKQNPSQNFNKHSTILKNPKIFQKPQNLGLNAWNAWIMREKDTIPSDLKQGKAENHVGWRFWERRECLGGE